jgi:hypothetical protein
MSVMWPDSRTDVVGKSTLRSSLLAGLLVPLLLAGCVTTETQPSAAVTTLAPGAQRWFGVAWTAEPGRDGERRLRGYVENGFDEAVDKVQLLAQALDASGNVIEQRLQWVSGAIAARGHVYFDIPKLPPAAQYRVSVWAYEKLKGVG